jgi:hypothetical protein
MGAGRCSLSGLSDLLLVRCCQDSPRQLLFLSVLEYCNPSVELANIQPGWLCCSALFLGIASKQLSVFGVQSPGLQLL